MSYFRFALLKKYSTNVIIAEHINGLISLPVYQSFSMQVFLVQFYPILLSVRIKKVKSNVRNFRRQGYECE